MLRLGVSSDVTFLLLLLSVSGPSRYVGGALAPGRGSGAIAVELNRKSPAARTAERNRRRLVNSGTNTGAVEVEDCENAEYSGRIGLGTPVQEFDVVLDTGSYTLWVTGKDCVDDCESNNKYDSSLSSTYVADGTVFAESYEDGSKATGILSIDTLSVGGLVTTATFGEMTTVSLDGCNTVDGIMGMGLSSSGDAQSVFEDFVDAGVVEIPVFSFFMGNIDSDSPTGVLTLGGVNQTHYEGCLQWVATANDALRDGYWSIVLQDLKIGSDSVLRSPASAILDTGTSLIVGPYEDVGYLADQIGAYCLAFSGVSSSSVSEVDCRNHPRDIELILMTCDSEFDDINFYFGGDDFALTPAELLLPLTDFGPPNPSTSTDPWCLFGMMGHDERLWILGDSFLRTFYTAYDVETKSVGLARATGHRTGDACSEDYPVSPESVEGGQAGAAGTATSASTSGGTSSSDSSPDAEKATSSTDTEEEAASTGVTSSSEGSTSSGSMTSVDSVGGRGSSEPESSAESDESGTESTSAASGSSDSDGGSPGSGDAGTEGDGFRDDHEGEPSSDEPNLLAVAAAASAGTLLTLAVCGGVASLIHRRIRRGQTHRHTKLGGVGQANGLEIPRKSAGGGGGEGAVVGAEDDFLQARPGGYRGSGSGSHRYRVAAEAASSGVGGVTVLANGQEEEEEEEDDDVVEVDFGVSNGADAGTPMGRLSRMFGHSRAGFTAFEDAEDFVGDGTPAQSSFGV